MKRTAVVLLCVLCAFVRAQSGSGVRPLFEGWANFGLSVNPATLQTAGVATTLWTDEVALDAIYNGNAQFVSTSSKPEPRDGFVSPVWATQAFGILANNADIPGRIFLERQTIVDIFLGKITKWNDPAIVADNPTLVFPKANIVLVHREESCGTTLLLTRVLSSFSTEWAERFGVVSVWPQELLESTRSLAVRDSLGVLDMVRSVHGSFGFVSLGHVSAIDRATLLVSTRNKRGQVVFPTLESITGLIDADEPWDTDLDGIWPFTANAYITFRESYSVPSDVACAGIKVGAQLYSTLASTTITDLIAESALAVAAPVRDRAATITILNRSTCNGIPLTEFPDPPLVYVYPYLTTPVAEADLVPVEPQEIAPYRNDLGHTIAEEDADPFELPDLPDNILYYDYVAEEAGNSAGRTAPGLLLLSLAFALSLMTGSKLSYSSRATAVLLILAVALAPDVRAVEVSSPSELHLGVLLDLVSNEAYFYAEEYGAIKLAVSQINADNAILPNTTLKIVPLLTDGSASSFAEAVVAGSEGGVDIIIGGRLSALGVAAASMAAVTELPYVSYGATTSLLSDTTVYPTFVRTVPSSTSYADMLAELIVRWDLARFGVTVFAAADTDGIASANALEARLRLLGFGVRAIVTVAEDASDATLLPVVLNARDSKSRVLVCFLDGGPLQDVLRLANKAGMINEHYMWMADQRMLTAALMLTADESGFPVEASFVYDWLRGMVVAGAAPGAGDSYNAFVQQWVTLDPLEYWASTTPPVSPLAAVAYDTVDLIARAYHAVYERQKVVKRTAEVVAEMKNTTFAGASGTITIEGNSRKPLLALYNWREGEALDGSGIVRGFSSIAEWTDDDDGSDHFVFHANPIFFDGTSNLPDLDVRNEIRYWSCEHREIRVDETGKTVNLDEPGRDAQQIADFYECDGFIDCYNMSDEWACGASLPIGFIVVGVIIGVMLLMFLGLILMVLALWLVKKEARITKAAPMVMLLELVCCILIVCSVFTIYGQPHDVSCVFAPWSMILPISVLIGAICIRPISIYLHFRFPNYPTIEDWHMVLIALLSAIPTFLLLVLWTVIATPSATLEKVDGEYHHVCGSNGFAGFAGGLVCFILICVYEGIILLVGAIVSLMARKVIVAFNESRLITTAIYNIAISGGVAIPIYFVLKSNNVARWSVMVGALLYVALSTMCIIFVPKIYGLLVIDPTKKKQAKELGLGATPTGDTGKGARNDLF